MAAGLSEVFSVTLTMEDFQEDVYLLAASWSSGDAVAQDKPCTDSKTVEVYVWTRLPWTYYK